MCRLLNPIYREDPEPERTFRLLRRFQTTGHLLGSPRLFLVFDLEEEPIEKERVMPDNNIIGIVNDMARNIRDYVVLDPNAMNICIILPEIIVDQFEFKSMMFKMLQFIGQYSGGTNEDPHLHLRKFLEVTSNFKIPGITNNSFRLRLFSYSLRD